MKAGASDINSHINDFGQEELFISFLRFTEKDPEIVFLAAETFCGVHLLSCILMIVGALKVIHYALTETVKISKKTSFDRFRDTFFYRS